MGKDESKEIKNQLLRLREDIFVEMRRRNTEAARPPEEGTTDFCDQGVNDNTRELLHLLSDAKREELVRIDEALDRIERGSYGQCIACGLPIDAKRLTLRPYARHCISCKELIEAKEKEVEPARGRI